jgi:hypothetical protein
MTLVLWFLVGGSVSGFSVASQWWFVHNLHPQSRRLIRWVFPAGMLIRFAMTGVLFWLAITHGILTGISFIAGLLVIRWGFLIWINSKQTMLGQGRTS